MAKEDSKTLSLSQRILKDPYWWLEPLAIFVLIFLTCFYYVYDVFYVVPQLLGSFGQVVNFVVSTWIVYNIFGNFWGCYRNPSTVDTLRPELMQPPKGEEHLWRYCEECQKMMPPRTWHCKLCKRCILKWDHHCNFTANCIGHNNQRYFIWLMFHLSLATGLFLVYNLIFTLRHGFNQNDWLLAYIPLDIDIFMPKEPGFVFRWLVRTIFYVNIVCLIFPVFLFVSQIVIVRGNAVCKSPFDRTYDLGVGRNFALVLGDRGFWTLLSPTIKSPLPHEGIQWQSKHSV